MLVTFCGIVLATISFGGDYQYPMSLLGAVIIFISIGEYVKVNKTFKITMISAVALGIFQLLCVAQVFSPIGEIDNFIPLAAIIKTVITSVLLISLYIAINKSFAKAIGKERVISILGLVMMNIAMAILVVLTPLLEVEKDPISSAMEGLVYVFVWMFVFIDLRLIPPLNEKAGAR